MKKLFDSLKSLFSSSPQDHPEFKEHRKFLRIPAVLVVEFENKVGTLAPVTQLLGSHDIAIHSVYGTSGDGFKIVGIFATSNNAQALKLINETSGSLASSES